MLYKIMKTLSNDKCHSPLDYSGNNHGDLAFHSMPGSKLKVQ